MFQNLKVDVIYYKTNTDFEMEFNLCGCCRMRLLTDKSPDKKAMVHSLARAVSRSKVIIVVGNLFGEEGITQLASSAIGSTLAVADNKAYGISGNESIEIINGSVPLVTAEGYFGGCIIESGPQTLILLSENKSIRKTVMKTLIHPYIEELCAIELKGRAEAAAEATADNWETERELELTQADEVIEELEIEDEIETIDNEEEKEPEAAELIINEEPMYNDEDIIQDEGYISEEEDDSEIEMESFEEDDDDGMYVDSDIVFEDSEMSMRDFIRRNEEYYNEQDTVRGLLTDEDELYPKRRGILNLPILIISIILLILFIVLCYCIFYIPSKDGVSASVYINEIFNTLFG